jgi:hypothetical protein
MKFFASLAMLALTLGLAGSAVAQDNTNSAVPGKREARMQQFRTDLETALANSTLTQEQKDALQRDFETVGKARRAKRSGETVDKEAVKAAWQNIRNTLQSDAIRPEDREKLQANMKQMRKHGGRKHNRTAPANNPPNV